MEAQTFSFIQYVPLIFAAVVIAIPFFRICKRLGLPRWLAILSIIPPVNIAFFYYLAYAKWPARQLGAPELARAVPE